MPGNLGKKKGKSPKALLEHEMFSSWEVSATVPRPLPGVEPASGNFRRSSLRLLQGSARPSTHLPSSCLAVVHPPSVGMGALGRCRRLAEKACGSPDKGPLPLQGMWTHLHRHEGPWSF